MARPTRSGGSDGSIRSASAWRSSARVAASVLAATCVLAGIPRSWRDGPVRVLLTDDERRAFGALGSDEERAAFVERFWRRLDPDTTTPETNEFRDRFEARCAL